MSEVTATEQASSVGVWRVQETFVHDYTKRTAKRQAVRKWELAWIRGPKANSLEENNVEKSELTLVGIMTLYYFIIITDITDSITIVCKLTSLTYQLLRSWHLSL